MVALAEEREAKNFLPAGVSKLDNSLTAFKFCRWLSHAEDFEAPLKAEGEIVVYEGKDFVLNIGWGSVAIPGLRVVAAGTKAKALLAKSKAEAWRSFIKAFSWT